MVVAFWYFLISLRATVPGLNLNFFFSFMPPEAGAVFLLFIFEATLDPLIFDWDLRMAFLELEAALDSLTLLAMTFCFGISK